MGSDAVAIVSAPVTVRVTVDVCTVLPAVPATVIAYEPIAVVVATAMVIVELPEPGAAIDAGLNETVAPGGSPDALKAIAELKPMETAVVIMVVPLVPWATEIEVGEAETVKVEATVKVRVTEVAAV